MKLFGAKLQYDAAMKYYKGVPNQGYGRNHKKAFKLFLEAAEAGLVDAMIRVSEMYFSGEGCRINHEEALKWMERAASKGSAEAQYNMGISYLWQNKYPIQGCEWLEKAANQGHVQAMFELGRYYVNHPFASSTFESAIKWLSIPALNNNPDAIYSLAKAYENKERYEYELEHPWLNIIDEIDSEEIMDYDAYNEMIENSFKPSNKVYKYYEKALQLYEEKISFGNWRCVLEAARMYLNGVGCEMNQEKAFDYYYRLAHQQEGEPNGECNEFYRIRAVLNLAKMYELGIGCKQDLEKRNELIQSNDIEEEWFKSYKI